MNCDKNNLMLYAVTDRAWTGERTLYEQIEDALCGGVTIVQLREKNMAEEDFYQEAMIVKKLCARYRVPFLINDHVELACRVDADGVHVGQDDMAAGTVRAMIGPEKILGVSVQTVEQALQAEAAGADYLGVGAVFTTSTKQDACEVSIDTLKAICEAVNIPVVAIGGINKDNIMQLAGSGIAGVALVSAIFASKDIQRECRELRERVHTMLEKA